MIVYPAIDLRGGRCVRLRQGDPNAETVYADDPVQMALTFRSEGATALHIVDLDGAFSGTPQHVETVAEVVAATGLPVQFGGGLRTLADLERAFAAGVQRCVIGTRALERDFLKTALARWPGRIVAGLDCRDGEVALQGWQQGSGVKLMEALALLRDAGISEVVYTDIGRDGMLAGPDVDGLKHVLASGLRAVASGGVRAAADVAMLAQLIPHGLTGAIIGKALYTGDLALPDALRAARRKRIIPCLDIRAGQVVKGVGFANVQDMGDPVALARRYEAEGADELAVLDIGPAGGMDASLQPVLQRLRQHVTLPLLAGGGIRTVADAQAAVAAGADKVSVGTAAVFHPDLIEKVASALGPGRVVVSIDVRRVRNDRGEPTDRWEVVTHGGRQSTGLDMVAWAQEAVRHGAGELLLNSIDADGTRDGYDLAATGRVADAVGVPVIASGGAGSVADMARVLTETDAAAALAASIFHTETVRIDDVRRALQLGVAAQ